MKPYQIWEKTENPGSENREQYTSGWDLRSDEVPPPPAANRRKRLRVSVLSARRTGSEEDETAIGIEETERFCKGFLPFSNGSDKREAVVSDSETLIF